MLRLAAAGVLIVCCVMAFQWLRREYIADARARADAAEKQRLAGEVRDREEKVKEMGSKNHKLNRRIERIERSIESIMESLERRPDDKAEFAQALEINLDAVKTLKETEGRNLEREAARDMDLYTGVPSLDEDLKLYARDMAAQGICFECLIYADLSELLAWKPLTVDELHQIFANLLDNAIRAVRESGSAGGRITLSVVREDEAMRVRVFDSGRYFEPVILRNLGAKENTDHDNGYGLVNVLEVLAQCDASFYIEEFVPPTAIGYTKSITLLFDGAGLVKVSSPRPGAQSGCIGIREALGRTIRTGGSSYVPDR